MTKFADWLEFGSIQSPNGRIGFSTLVSAADISTEEQSDDISDEEIWEDELVLSVQNEINAKLRQLVQIIPSGSIHTASFLSLWTL